MTSRQTTRQMQIFNSCNFGIVKKDSDNNLIDYHKDDVMGDGASDVSGSKDGGQANHASLILGEGSTINRIHNKIGIRQIHMSNLSEKNRKRVIQNLNFSSNEIQCWCFHMDRQLIENELLNHDKLRARTPKLSIHRNFDKYWLRSFQDRLDEFLASRKEEVSDITIQTDSDMSHTTRNWGMQNAHEGKAHELADAVAWCNQKGIKIKGCKVMDVRDGIQRGMYHDLLKG